MKLRKILYIIFIGSTLSIASDKPNLKILVTGGAGFIGSHVVETLIKRGNQVVIVDNMNDYYDVRLKKRNMSYLQSQRTKKKTITFYETDICDIQALRNIFQHERPDVICHLAARAGVRPSVENPELYCQTNVLGTVHLLQMAHEFSVKNFIFASSSSVYGQLDTMPFQESKIVDKPVSPYAAMKRSGELLVYAYHALYKIPCTCLRFFTVYGPRGRPDMAPFKFLDAIYHSKEIFLYGDGEAIRDFTYIDDVVDAVIKAIDIPSDYEIFNVGRGEPISIQNFIKIIEEVLCKKAIIRTTSQMAGDVFITHADISKAREKLGYIPKVSIKEGIEKLYQWYVNEYLHLIGTEGEEVI